MLDIGWVELMLIAVVLIVVVGPKDLPRMLRTFGRFTSQLRSMAGDFRKQFDDALKEAEMDEIRKVADDVRKLDPRKDIRAAMNPMKSIGDEIRSSLKSATEAPEAKVPSAGAAPSAQAPDKTGPTKKSGGWDTAVSETRDRQAKVKAKAGAGAAEPKTTADVDRDDTP